MMSCEITFSSFLKKKYFIGKKFMSFFNPLWDKILTEKINCSQQLFLRRGEIYSNMKPYNKGFHFATAPIQETPHCK